MKTKLLDLLGLLLYIFMLPALTVAYALGGLKMKGISSLYPKGMKENHKKINVDKFFELRKVLGNHWSYSLWGAFLGDDDER